VTRPPAPGRWGNEDYAKRMALHALPASRTRIGVYIHETLPSPSCGLARFRRVGLACRARLRVAADIVLAKVCRN
jgi:hypothetical protein